jgi:26S proteasome regulatory subunit N3
VAHLPSSTLLIPPRLFLVTLPPSPSLCPPPSLLPDPSHQPHPPASRIEIAQNVALLEKAVATSEPRFITRALRASVHVRQALTPDLLASAISSHLKDAKVKQELLALVGGKAETSSAPTSTTTPVVTPSALPQVEMYVALLVVYLLHDSKLHAKVGDVRVQCGGEGGGCVISGRTDLSTHLDATQGFAFTTKLVEQIHALNLRSLDQISSRIFFYFARFYELEGQLVQVRPLLLNALRTATLRNDADCQVGAGMGGRVCLSCCLLRYGGGEGQAGRR